MPSSACQRWKTHRQSPATLALRNLKGLVPDTLKKQSHTTFGVFRSVAEFNTVVKPALSIVDTMVAQEALGPVFGALFTWNCPWEDVTLSPSTQLQAS
ncbi:DUF362 domain-containing protein [Chloroflexota bacterium]